VSPAVPPGAASEPERRAEVLAALDEIRDPCSVSIGRPIGLVGMGIIDAVTVGDDAVAVTVLPTFPDCLFRGVFAAEIEARLTALPWCRAVTVGFAPADRDWDETRMAPAARQRLGRKPRPARAAA
jgi:metal-sulfur cluster biosynthetic enzyme